MPGIVGQIGGSTSEELRADLELMVQSLMHESFYQSAAFIENRLSIALGAAFQPNSFASGQPFWNGMRNICLIFSGECFGLDELSRKEHATDGNHVAESARSLVHLYEQHGLSFLKKLNGTFSGALLDLRTNQVFLFTDRYGLGRIYCYRKPDAFYFASEAKALLRILPELKRLDPVALAEQFSCGCVLQNRTLFPGINLLPGGSVWTIEVNGGIREAKYFDPTEWEEQPPLDKETYYETLKSNFSRALPRYFRGSEPAGMSLTGGLDGRMMMSYAPSSNGRFPCYTFGGSYRDCADVSIARAVARASGHSHNILPINTAFLNQFPSLAEKSVYISDGTMGVAGAVELQANRAARSIAPVRLTGNYGSEILRGNVAFRPTNNAHSFVTPDFACLVGDAAATYDRERSGNTLSFIAFKQVPWHHYSRLSIEQSQLTVRSPYLDNDLVATAYRVPEEQRSSASPALRLISEGNPALAKIPTDRGLLFSPSPFKSRVFRAWQEFSVRAEYAYDYGMPQWLATLDHALASLHLERLFLGRHKFYHFRIWYRDQLAPFVREVLLDASSLARPYLERSAVERIVHQHTTGRANHTNAIHQLLSAELTQRQLTDC